MGRRKGRNLALFSFQLKNPIGFIERFMSRTASHLVNGKVFLGSFLRKKSCPEILRILL